MKDKEKQIQEIAQIICGRSKDDICIIDNTSCDSSCCWARNAEAIYNVGYRKLPKDSVVLSREEYEKLRSLYDCEQGSYMTSSIGDLHLTVEGLRKVVDEITRLSKVEAELQELNIKYYNEAKDLRRELKQARKEAAEKILFKFESAFAYYDNEDMFSKKAIFECLEEIVKSLGVEIKEYDK